MGSYLPHNVEGVKSQSQIFFTLFDLYASTIVATKFGLVTLSWPVIEF